ncbi:MAG: hypothetical protein LBC02_11935 [Planctomycetaceae bacterium]|jgi:transcriptional regulator of heat shock response|nr:hypothetical protein [Planctomycetaceae bacterium]
MENQNIADISIFESIQTEQHKRTDMSQMSVFNDAASVKRAIDEEQKQGKQLDDLYRTLKKTEQDYNKAIKETQDKVAKLKSEYEKETANLTKPKEYAALEKAKEDHYQGQLKFSGTMRVVEKEIDADIMRIRRIKDKPEQEKEINKLVEVLKGTPFKFLISSVQDLRPLF